MKKSKLLVGVLVASMALLGTGYAYWSDTLTVNATVKTGELNVVYKTGNLKTEKGDFKGVEKESVGAALAFHGPKPKPKPNPTPVDPKDGYINWLTASATAKNVEISMSNLYPGSFASVIFEAENKGSIPAVIENIDVNLKNIVEENGKSFADVLQVLVETNKDGKFDKLENEASLKGAVPLSELEEFLNKKYKGERLGLKQGMVTRLTVFFPGTAASGDEFENLGVDKCKQEQKFELVIDWTQHNKIID